MRAFVTGAGGFVGSHLVAHLAAAGDDVVPFDGEITDAAAVREALTGARPEAVYHLAARSHIGESWGSPAEVFRVNAEGTLNVLLAARDVPGVRVLVMGSADQYGAAAQMPVTEEAPLRPVTPYGASKAAADVLALQAFLGEGVETVRVRAFNQVGPGQASGFLVPAVARRILDAQRDGTRELPMGSLDPVRDFTDVRDSVRAYRLLVERGVPGEAYNVCSGVGRSVREIVEAFVSLAGADVTPVVDPALLRPVDVPVLVGDHSKLRSATGWAPEIALDQTLRDVIGDV